MVRETFSEVLRSIKKYFFDFFTGRVERYPHCLSCSKELTGSQRKFCSKNCANKYSKTKSYQLNSEHLRSVK